MTDSTSRLREQLERAVRHACERQSQAPSQPWRATLKLTRGQDGSTSYRQAATLDALPLSMMLINTTIESDHYAGLRQALLSHDKVRSNILKFLPPDDQIDPQMADSCILSMFLAPFFQSYAERCEDVSFDQDAFQVAYDRLIESSSKHAIMITLCPLRGITLPSETHIPVGSGLLREPTVLELERWLSNATVSINSKETIHNITSIRAMIEYRSDSVDDGRTYPDVYSVETDTIVTLIRLISDAKVSVPFVETTFQGINDMTLYRSITPFPITSENVVADEALLRQVHQFMARLHNRRGDRKLQLALRRWSLGSQRASAEDRLIDYWVGLEALFCPDGPTEMIYRASLRVASYVGESSVEKISLKKRMRDSYNARSKLVHGDIPKDDSTNIADETGSVLRRALLKILNLQGTFKADDIEDMLLGSTASAP